MQQVRLTHTTDDSRVSRPLPSHEVSGETSDPIWTTIGPVYRSKWVPQVDVSLAHKCGSGTRGMAHITADCGANSPLVRY